MDNTVRMPALFVGHGSPMNAIENNIYTLGWQTVAARLPKPKAILAVSAHWYTRGTFTSDAAQPRTVHDMFGFPKPLYDVRYRAPGAPWLAESLTELLADKVAIDNGWGIDHGTWSVLVHMYPQADIPVVQLSIDGSADAAAHLAMGRSLSPLRDAGVLILGSGNVVHNLALVDWDMPDGFIWADTFDLYIQQEIEHRRFENVTDWRSAGESAHKAFHTPEHFYPLLYVLGASSEADKLTVFNDDRMMGAMSMTSYLFE